MVLWEKKVLIPNALEAQRMTGFGGSEENLAGIIEESGVSGVQDFSNEQGKTYLTGLEEGMHLVVQSDNSSKVASWMLIWILCR